MTPDFDPVPESELWAMAPAGVSVHASRVPWSLLVRGTALAEDLARAFAEPPHVDRAVDLLAGIKPQAILYAFTSSSYTLEAGEEDALRARLAQRAAGAPVLLTGPAAIAALRTVAAKRIAVIHPPWFSPQFSEIGAHYYHRHGFDVACCVSMTPARSFAEVPAGEIFDWVQAHVPRQADAVFIAGNGLRAAGVIDALEQSLRRPVLTANQVLLWEALRRLGAAARVVQYGQVFAAAGP